MNIIKPFKELYLVTLIIFTILLSCSNDKENEVIQEVGISEQKRTKLIEDYEFIEYYEEVNKTLKNIKNPYRVIELSSKNEKEITNIELEELSNLMGFDSFEEYHNYLKKQKRLLLSLEDKHNLFLYTEEEIKNMIYSSKVFYSNDCVDLCDSASFNCLALASSGSIAGHLACTLGDPTVVVGIICHAAVATTQYFANGACNDTQQQCHQACLNP